MNVFVALLRAVNVGGTGKLPMSDLKDMCDRAGFRSVRTYISSGNAVFESEKSEAEVKAALERALGRYAGKPMDVLVRSTNELGAILRRDPFPRAPRNLNVVVFLDKPPPSDVLRTITGQAGEEIALGRREIYVHYVSGIGRSKLKIPAAQGGTARNMNTVSKLVAMSRGD